MESIQVGVDVSVSTKKKQSASVRVTGRGGPARVGLDGLLQVYKSRILCFDLLPPKTREAENRPIWHAGLSFRRCFHQSTGFSLHFSFISSPFELESIPHLAPASFYRFRTLHARLWVQTIFASRRPQ